VNGQSELTVRNPNDQADVTVEIHSPDGFGTVDLGPGESKTFTDVSDGTYTIRTVVDGSVVAESSVNFDCQRDVQQATADGELCQTIRVSNNGSAPMDLRVRNASTGDVVATETDVQPSPSQGIQASEPGNYIVDARLAGNGSFGSGNLTVNGQQEVSLSVQECDFLPRPDIDISTECFDGRQRLCRT